MSIHSVEEHQSAVYEIAGRHYDIRSPDFAAAIARAYANQQRPRCVCRPEGIETYVARLNDGYVVKRMPDTGNQHAASCPHFEPPADASGLRPLLGTAIREDPVTGLTSLKLDFSLSRSPQRLASSRTSACGTPSVRSCPRLSLRGLLLYLWEQAGLTRWQPIFAGKRTWAMVRKRLLQAAGDKIVGGRPLLDRLFLPEPFLVEQREAIGRRRAAFWAMAGANSAGAGQLLLMIGELKEISPARCGFRAVVKQMPDQAFIVDERLYSRITRHLQPELALWSVADGIRMLVVATFGAGAAGVPTILELALIPTTRDWLPVKDVFEHQLVERLVAENRSFLKDAPLDPRSPGFVRCATLIDRSRMALALFVVTSADQINKANLSSRLATETTWAWNVAEGPIPALPWS
ncbi:MAG: DUF1173 family protein [Burkholderiales bacterium]|nr:DUF1173 family protein [Burkholderiales bacterium]